MKSFARIKNYILQLNQLYSGGNFLDENFDDKLASIDESLAFTAPMPGVHSIAEVVWHCIYWRNVNFQRLLGNNNYRDDTVDDLNWVSIKKLKLKGWVELKAEFNQSQRELIQLLSDKSDDYLLNEYDKGKDFAYLVDGTIQHDAYHLGQIGLIIKLLKLQGIIH